MLPITEKTLRASFVNASRRESNDLPLPDGFDATPWADLDYLGWHDPKIARRAYVVVPGLDGEVVGVLLTSTDRAPRSRALCSWCRDVRLPNGVVTFGAKRAGAAGRRGDSVATLVCEGFECSLNVRKDPPLPYEGFDAAAARAERIDVLRLRVAGFADVVREGA